MDKNNSKKDNLNKDEITQKKLDYIKFMLSDKDKCSLIAKKICEYIKKD